MGRYTRADHRTDRRGPWRDRAWHRRDAGRREGVRQDSAGTRPAWRAALPGSAARHRRSARILRALRRDPGTERRARCRERSACRHAVEPEGGRQVCRPARRRPGLAHRHVVSRRDGLRERAVRHPHPAPQRRPARRHRVLQHARRLRRAAGRYQDTARRCDRDARLREVLGAHAPRQGERAARR